MRPLSEMFISYAPVFDKVHFVLNEHLGESTVVSPVAVENGDPQMCYIKLFVMLDREPGSVFVTAIP